MTVPEPTQGMSKPLEGEGLPPWFDQPEEEWQEPVVYRPKAKAAAEKRKAPKAELRAYGSPLQKRRVIDPKKFQYYLGDEALVRLAWELDVPPEKQQEVLRHYAKDVVQQILKDVKCRENTGFLLNLDWPASVEDLRGQLLNLIKNIDQVYDLNELQGEEFEACVDLVTRIRRDIVLLIEKELEAKRLDRKVGILGKEYGHGGMGTVFSCRLGDGDVAAKLMTAYEFAPGGEPTYHQYPELIEATRESENLVRFFGSLDFEGEFSDRLDFFEELKGSVSLIDHMNQNLDESPMYHGKLRKFLKTFYLPILKGTKAIHDKGLYHGDMKWENVFVSKKGEGVQVKLGDYDFVRRSGYRPPDGVIQGTLAYTSPEQIQEDECTCKTDIYALGIMLFYVLGGPKEKNSHDHTMRVADGDFDMRVLSAPQELRQIIRQCMHLKPEDRPDIGSLIRQVEGFLASDELRRYEKKGVVGMSSRGFRSSGAQYGGQVQAL